jgi:hypothetical protein
MCNETLPRFSIQYAISLVMYDLDLGCLVEVAVRRAAPVQLVHMRTFSNAAAEKTLHMFRQIQD